MIDRFALLAGLAACLLLPAIAAAQDRPETAEAEARVLDLGAEILARHGLAPRTPSKAATLKAAALDTLDLVRSRAGAFAALIRWDPGRALAAAFPEETLDRLRAANPRLGPHLEERGSWQGAATMYVADDFEQQRSVEFHVLDTPQGLIEAYGVPRGTWTRNGDRIAVSGIAIGGRIAVRKARALSAAEPRAQTQDLGLYPAAMNCDPTGEQRTAVFLVYKRGTAPPSITSERLYERVFGTGHSLDRYVRTVSFGRAWLSGEVFGPLELDDVTVADSEIAAAAGLTDLSHFRRYVTIGQDAAPGVGGSSSLGCNWGEQPSSTSAVNLFPRSGYDGLSLKTLIHEYGHALGLAHAKSLLRDGEALGPAPSLMEVSEYGDRYDPMGVGSESHFYNARHLLGIGWLDPDNVVTAEGEGTFTVKLLDDGTPPDSPVALRIRRHPNTYEWLWVEALSDVSPLTPYGFSRDHQPSNEALVRYRHPSLYLGATFLLDFRSGHRELHFPAGRTWEDSYGSLSLTVESVSPAGLTVRVERDEGGCFSVSPTLKTYSYLQQEGVFDVHAEEGCAWQARSDSDWIEMDAAAASGVGPAQVRYALRGHAGGGDRSGKIAVGQQVHVVIQQSNAMPPVIEELSRHSGSGETQVFRVVVSDPNSLLRNSEDAKRNFYYQSLDLSYGNSSCRGSYRFSVRDGYFSGGDGVCFDKWRSRVTYEEGKAVLEYHFNLSENAGGVLRADARVMDRSALVGRKRRTWVVGAASENGPPVITDAWGGVSTQSKRFWGHVTVEDPDGVPDIANVYVKIASMDGSKWCAAVWSAWSPVEQDVALGGAAGTQRAAQGGAPLENEYCIVVPSMVWEWEGALGDGRLQVGFSIYFSQAFAGPKTFLFAASDFSGHRVYTEYETIDDPDGQRHPVLPGAVSPASGSGESQRFEWTFLHPEGGEEARYGRLGFSGPGYDYEDFYCAVVVSDDWVSLERYYGDDTGTRWDRSDFIQIGSDAVLENELCSIDVSGMKDEAAGNARSLSALIGFKPAFRGPLTVHVDNVARGAWHPGDPGAGPWIVPTVSAASYGINSADTPGGVVTIFGGGLGPATTVQARADEGRDMPRELAGTRVRVGGTPLPLLSVDSGRIDAVLPNEEKHNQEMIVERNGLSSNPVRVRSSSDATFPGLFAMDGSGAGQARAVHQEDGSFNSLENPAPKGSIIVLYATGLGQTDPFGIDGRIAAAGVLPEVRAPVSVIIGNRAAEVLFAGGVPGMVAGIAQVKVRIGASTPGGSHIPIQLIAGDGYAYQFLTIAVE